MTQLALPIGSYYYNDRNTIHSDHREEAVIFVNGPSPIAENLLLEKIKNAAQVIGVDGGSRHCMQLGVTPHLVVGDLDSADKQHLTELAKRNVRILKKTDQETTDLEYALQCCVDWGKVKRVTILGGIGGRLDHSLYHLKLLTCEKYAGRVFLDSPFQLAVGLRDGQHAEVKSFQGQQVSVYTLNDKALKASSDGLRWPIQGAPVSQSNESEGEYFSVKILEGDGVCMLYKKEKGEEFHS